MRILVLAAFVALATPAFGSDLDRKVKDLEQTVKQLRKEVTYMMKADMELMDAYSGWRKEVLRVQRNHEKFMKSLELETGKTIEAVMKFIAGTQQNTLERCAVMIERHGRIAGVQQPRDLKDRLLRGLR